MIYLDSSAVVKLVHEEPESAALESWLRDDDRPLVTSVLTEVEVERALRRADPDPDAVVVMAEVIDGVYRFDMDAAVRRTAAGFTEPALRTLDAVHLATALEFGSDLQAFVCYDRRLLDAAAARGIAVTSPGSDS